MSDYAEFLKTKTRATQAKGFANDAPMEYLWDWQRELVRWACEQGTAALFVGTGLGKTRIQLAWADAVCRHAGSNVLILAPLAVTEQTKREGELIGINVNICRKQEDCIPGINITNYEMVSHFDPAWFAGVVPDESGILKSMTGKTRTFLIEFAKPIPYRLCCTATPAPNDLIEIVNHAEFLGVLRVKECIARFFTQDGNNASKYRLKGHATKDFYRWMGTWARAIRLPSDLGYDDGEYVLPKLHTHKHVVDGCVTEGYLISILAHTLKEQRQARAESLPARLAIVADIANSTDQPMICWCDYNYESEALRKAIPDSVEVKGSDSIAYKTDAIMGFIDGRYRVLVSKAAIFGWGLNLQHCNLMAFVGLSHSFESYYQAIRRCYRFGQKREVHVHIVTAETEDSVVQNIMRKQAETEHMMGKLVEYMGQANSGRAHTDDIYHRNNGKELPSWLSK